MLKKLFRYLGVGLGLLTCLPLFLANVWTFATKSSLGNSSADYKLFDDFAGVETALAITNTEFASFFVTLLQIVVILAVVLAVLLMVVYILNDLGILKAQKFEKLIAVLLLVVVIVGLLAVLLSTIINKGSLGDSTGALVGGTGAWLFVVFGAVGAILAMLGASEPKKSRKRK